MLKNIIGFTSQEREELNDKKDFLKKMIMDYCGPKFMLTEICSLRNYWVNRDNINDVRIGIAGKGSKSLISIGYVDSIGKAYYFDTPEEAKKAYLKLLKK